jgi:hypothetical protein
MEAVRIPPTEKTPEIILNPNGFIKILGRAIDESMSSYPEQVMNWLSDYVEEPAEKTEVTVALEYLNSYNTIILSSFLRKIDEVKAKSGTLLIKWYIEKDDEDLQDRAEALSSTFHLPVECILTDKIRSIF